jgi:formate/nitrite transporter FocA (FNT family)
MDYTKPADVAQAMIETAAAKATLSVKDLLIRGFLSGALLGFATSQIPVTVGNFLAGWLLIGLPIFLTYGKQVTERETKSPAEIPEKARVPA